MKTLPIPTDMHQLIIAHVRRVVDEANASKIAIPKAVVARVVLSQVTTFLNAQIARHKDGKTLTPVVKTMIQASLDEIKKSFIEHEVPMPSTIIDDWNAGKVRFRPIWNKQQEAQFTIDQLLALPGIDSATEAAIAFTVASLRSGKAA